MFEEGWGPEASFQRPEEVGPAPLEWSSPRRLPWGEVRTGRFVSPASGLPSASAWAHVEFWLPPGSGTTTPVAIHFAATGDQGYTRRRLLTAPLLARGIGFMLLESPFYGRRRPAGQSGTRLRTVADLLTLIHASVCEGLALLRALQDDGYRQLGVCGISRGGQVAAITASLHRGPLALAVVAAAHSASEVFTRGVMQIGCAWGRLGGRESALPRLRQRLGSTDIRCYPTPMRPDAAVLVGGLRDAYIPRDSLQLLHEALPGSSLHWLSTGHIGTLLFHPCSLAGAVTGAFRRLATP